MVSGTEGTAMTALLLFRGLVKVYSLNNIGSLEGTLQYYHHATPGGSPGVAW